jgi:chitin disaccharide deacetylase
VTAGRHLIVNADDLGASAGVNRGILECVERGIVTSASLMVDMPASEELASDRPDQRELSVGLHVMLTSECGELAIAPDACRGELDRQLARFEALLGRRPTHVDSHHNVHLDPPLRDQFVAFAAQLGVPLRAYSAARYFADFYGQWDDGETHLELLSVDSLVAILETEVGPGVTELGCHPGYVDEDLRSSYAREREAELRTLCDPAVRERLAALEIRLVNFADLPAITAGGPQ